MEQTGVNLTFIEDAKDPLSARIDLFVVPLPAPQTSAGFIESLAIQMKARYPTFQLDGLRALSEQPDVTAVLFSYMDGGDKVTGFGIAQCNSLTSDGSRLPIRLSSFRFLRKPEFDPHISPEDAAILRLPFLLPRIAGFSPMIA